MRALCGTAWGSFKGRAERAAAEELPAEEVAAQLAFRLAKLDAMRRAVEALQARPQLRRDIFTRGDPEQVKITSNSRFEGDLYALVQSYVDQRTKDASRQYHPPRSQAYALDDARRRLRSQLPSLKTWTALTAVAPMDGRGGEGGEPGPSRASYLASTLAAGLELVREGELEARQVDHFADLYLRARSLRLDAAE